MTNPMRLRTLGGLSCLLGLVVVMAGLLAGPAEAVGNPVIVCHEKGNGEFNSISTDDSGAISGHSGHANDIIPPIPGLPDGLNWDDDGQAIHQNGCVVPEPTTTTTSTTSTTTTTEATTTTTEATTTTRGPEVLAAETLPHTGAGSAKLLAVGLLLVVGGGLCLTVGDDWLREAAGLHYATPRQPRR